MFQNFFPHTIFSIFSKESINPLSSLINLFIQIFILSQVKKTTKKGALDADQESQVNIFPLHLISTPLQMKILFLSKPLLVKSKMIQLFQSKYILPSSIFSFQSFLSYFQQTRTSLKETKMRL